MSVCFIYEILIYGYLLYRTQKYIRAVEYLKSSTMSFLSVELLERNEWSSNGRDDIWLFLKSNLLEYYRSSTSDPFHIQSIHSATNNVLSDNKKKCETSKTKSRSNITPGTTLQCSIVELMEFNWLKWRNDFFLWSNLLKISVDGNYTRHLTYGGCRWLTVWLAACYACSPCIVTWYFVPL